MKKKITALCLCVALLTVALVGVTYAYLTSSATVKNTFTVGNIQITMDETDVTKTDGSRTNSNAYTIMPGAVLPKDPTVHNKGNNDAYIRATVKVDSWANLCTTEFYPDYTYTLANDEYKNSLLLLVKELGEGWSIEDFDLVDYNTMSITFTLKYDKVLKAGEDTTAIFQNIYIPTTFGTRDANGGYAVFEMDEMVVEAQAIQADGFDSWDAAFTAFDEQTK